jgi:hypothetical protein
MCSAEMKISEQTVKNFVRDIFDRVGVWSRLELACRYAWEWKSGLYPDAPHPLERHREVMPRKGMNANPRGINRWNKRTTRPRASSVEQRHRPSPWAKEAVVPSSFESAPMISTALPTH